MADASASPGFAAGVALLDRAVGYTLGCLNLVTPGAMTRPTPCGRWDLRALLRHMDDSLLALQEAIDLGQLDLAEATTQGDPGNESVAVLKHRVCRLRGALADPRNRGMVSVAGCPLSASIVTSAGAVEVAVHGWDVATACGHHRPIPVALAAEMLDLAPLFVTPADRPARFAAPLRLSRHAGASDRLIGFLGRRPR